jgi:hypothetical protein
MEKPCFQILKHFKVIEFQTFEELFNLKLELSFKLN